MNNRKKLALAAILTVTAATLLNSCAPAQTPTVTPDGYTLRPALSGERRTLTLPAFGKITYYANPNGEGRPLILTHSVNAAASAYEMKPLWDTYAGKRPVYALEWPGFGSSDRPDIPYTPELMTSALQLLMQTIHQDADVVSLSLGSEFAARAALQDTRIKTLTLISPSGLGNPRGGTQRANDNDRGVRLYNTLNAISTPLYSALRTRTSINYFLSRSFRGSVPQDLVDYAIDTTRQPGAKYAPVYFVSGRLFTQNAYDTLYSKLGTPTLVLYDKDAFVSFDRLPEFTQKNNVTATRIPDTDGLPHFEKLSETKAALDAFWARNP